MSGRTEFQANVKFTFSMDDTTVREAKEAIEGRINEMLATLERKDDIRILLLHQCDVSKWT